MTKGQKRKNDGKQFQPPKGRGNGGKGKQVQTYGSPKIGGCPKCGKSHRGECLAGRDVCFICKQPGHSSYTCPTKKNKGVTIPSNPSSGRVFTLSGKKAKKSDNLITGTCFLNQEPLIVLFYSSATHSFISSECGERLKLHVSVLPYPLIVSTPAEGNIETSLFCENCPLVISKRVFLVDLVCLPLKGLDVILGIDWLSANHVMLNCQEKTITFPYATLGCIESNSFLYASASQVSQCLRNGDQRFILLLSSSSTTDMNVATIPVVREFEDVFPEDVVSLPQKER